MLLLLLRGHASSGGTPPGPDDRTASGISNATRTAAGNSNATRTAAGNSNATRTLTGRLPNGSS